MSNFTNYGENKFADFLRGQGLTLPTNWYAAPLSAVSDSSVTEVTGSGITRVAVARSLAAWAGTQGSGTTTASSGTSKTTSNNASVNMGTAAGSVGTVTHIGLFDASTDGNCWCYAALASPIVTAAAVAIAVSAGQLEFTLGDTGGSTNYLVNKLIDKFFRAQTYDWPATIYLAALVSSAEVGGGVNYSRASIASSMAAWSGTQGAGTTSASSGTSGRISNNATIAFADPSGSWGAVEELALVDAATSGNRLWAGSIAPKTIGVGIPLYILADKLGITIA